MKSSFYFDHDYSARNDQKVLCLRAEFGWFGYGVYFAILESLCESNGYIKRVALAGLSVGLNMDKAELTKIVDYCIEIELFHSDEEGFFSNRIVEHLEYRKSLSDAGKKGGRGKKKVSDKKPPFSHPKATPEAGKKRKEEESKDIIPEWRNDFSFYQEDCRAAFDKLTADKEWMQLRERDNPGVDIKKTLIKACTEFWVTEAGWKHKKKSKSKELDWSATFINTINLKSNRIYKQK